MFCISFSSSICPLENCMFLITEDIIRLLKVVNPLKPGASNCFRE